MTLGCFSKLLALYKGFLEFSVAFMMQHLHIHYGGGVEMYQPPNIGLTTLTSQ